MESDRVQRVLRQHIHTDALLGLDAIPTHPPTHPPVAAVPITEHEPAAARSAAPDQRIPRAPVAAAPRLTAPPAISIDPNDDKATALRKLREALSADERVLAKLTPGTQLVFGEGDPDAQIMFIGEGAGEEEARTGRPFVGRAGQLLDNMIKAMGLSREAVYITNCVHFRPPGNRVPTPEEIDLGWPYMLGQVQIVKPQAIVALGGTSAKALLNTATGITRLRGSWYEFDAGTETVPLMPTFHPAFLLRSYTRDNRSKVWADLVAVLARLGKTPPAPKV